MKRQQTGSVSISTVLSSHTGCNAELFQQILSLHVPEGSRIADVTYGMGAFWRGIDTSKYEFFPSDIKTGIDARSLPYKDCYLDALVLDPPYMEGLYRNTEDKMAGGGSHKHFRECYSNAQATPNGTLRYHDQVVDMYMLCALESSRVLKMGGVFIVKCQDEVSSNRQKLTHVELIYGFEKMGFYCKDLFVLTRSNHPVISRLNKQVHARKNHSYFLVFVKTPNKLPYSNFRPLLETYARNPA